MLEIVKKNVKVTLIWRTITAGKLAALSWGGKKRKSWNLGKLFWRKREKLGERGKIEGRTISLKRQLWSWDFNLLSVCCLLFCTHLNFWWHLHFFFSPFSSYESSWAKSLHYKTIRSEASGNAAGIRCSLPTAAVRNGGGEGVWMGGAKDRR